MTENKRVVLTKAQIAYVVRVTEISEPKDAVRAFAKILEEEQIDSHKISEYVDRLMMKEGL